MWTKEQCLCSCIAAVGQAFLFCEAVRWNGKGVGPFSRTQEPSGHAAVPNSLWPLQPESVFPVSELLEQARAGSVASEFQKGLCVGEEVLSTVPV